MNHNEFEAHVEVVFAEQREFIIDQCKKDNRYKFGMKFFQDDLCRSSDKDRNEIIDERNRVIRLCEKKIRDGLICDEGPRLQALKAAQKKIKSSIERRELELLKGYRKVLFTPALFLFALMSAVFYLPLPHSIFEELTKKIILNIPLFSVFIALFLFIGQTVCELYEKSILVMKKRCLEIVEQAIELGQTRESTNG